MKLKLLPIWRWVGQIKKDSRRFFVSCRVVKLPFCILSTSSSRTHLLPSSITSCQSRQSWTQMNVKSRASFSLNLHPSTKRFAFIWVHDRGDRRMVDETRQWDGERDKFERNWHLEYNMAACLQGTTQKRHKSLLIWPTFDRNFNLQMGKIFNFI